MTRNENEIKIDLLKHKKIKKKIVKKLFFC